MHKPRHINSDPHARSLPSTLAVAASPVREVAWIVEERVVWRGADFFRAMFDAVKWPFEQIGWHAERRLIWPIQERTADWSPSLRIGSTVAAALLLGGIIVALAISSSSPNRGLQAVVARSAAVPVAPKASGVSPAAPVSTLHGAPPVFSSSAGTGGVKASPKATADTGVAHASTAAPVAASSGPATAAAPGQIADEAAVSTAREFSNAFVLYEIAQVDPEVRATFRETATKQVVGELLHRPPRLPANVEVPKAKVLNVVAGPQLGDNCTVSVSLLRVGITSELRLSMHRTKNGTWLVSHMLG